jgi:hypothetical protein
MVHSVKFEAKLDTEINTIELITNLLDNLIILGQQAQQLSTILGGNGHRATNLKELLEVARG